MKDSIIQGITAAVAGILFCVAVTLLLREVNALTETERSVESDYGIVIVEETYDERK